MKRVGTPAPPAESVRTIELFFDLVFVFTITQVTHVLAGHPKGSGVVRSFVLLAVIWWMYGGYVWLTNALDLDRTPGRLLVLAGMAGFFVMSLAVPHYFGDGRWALVFGLAYLTVVIVHGVGFFGTSGHYGIKRIGPLNLGSALVIVGAGLVGPGARVWMLVAAVAIEGVSPWIAGGVRGFAVGAGHFVERHGLALIILLGESIIGIGSAAIEADDMLVVVAGSLLALAVCAALWWLYFDREEAAGERALANVPDARRGIAALLSYGYAYLFVIFGVTLVAVGLAESVAAFREPLPGGLPRWLLGAGMACYLVSLAAYHRVLAPAWQPVRLGAALVVLGAVPLAGAVAGWLALAVAGAVVLGTLVLEDARTRSRPTVGGGSSAEPPAAA